MKHILRRSFEVAAFVVALKVVSWWQHVARPQAVPAAVATASYVSVSHLQTGESHAQRL